VRTLALLVVLLGACGTVAPSGAPRGHVVDRRLERPPGIPPDDADTANTAMTPHSDPVGPLRDLPPSPIIQGPN
jgi:hypothetical protein